MSGETDISPSKKPGRKRLARRGHREPPKPDRAVPVEPALNRLLERLLADTMWLREQPESENVIADKTSIPKSTVREAVIALIKVGCLKRTPDGLLRDTLNADRLIPLYAQRLRIELLAFRQVFDLRDVKRQTIADNLQMYWRRQREANQQDAQNNTNAEFMKWLHAGMDFHGALVRSADMLDEANLLSNLMVQMRVGSFKKVDDLATREAASEDHLTYIRLVSDGPRLEDEPNLVWHEFVANHLKASFKAALATGEDSDGTNDGRKARMWKEVINRATGDPRAGP
jgi:DNA-binding GntR family transcriptional regulator